MINQPLIFPQNLILSITINEISIVRNIATFKTEVRLNAFTKNLVIPRFAETIKSFSHDTETFICIYRR